MKIALDFDNTITADPDLWIAFVAAAKARGHTVKIVTYRYPEQTMGGILNIAEIMDVEVVFTSYTQKRTKWDADVWIDDMPELIPLL